ncbi:MAG TPA: M48 family metallopeptidase [Vicinamibacteria bacterium]|nr:M48 family metallopeptidase [Vicinamibacteria bacterium]
MRLVLLLSFLSASPVFAQPRFDPEAETEAYLSRVPAEELERSDAYFEGGYWLQLIGYLYTLGIAWFLLASRFSARTRDWAESRAGRGFLATTLYMVPYGVVTFVLGFPLTLYQGFIREHHYGLANQSFGPWMRDQLVALGVSLLLLSVAVAGLYVAIRTAGSRWWLWGSVGGVVFLSFVLLIGPLFIFPLFNQYEPLDDPELTAPILSLARANGVQAEDVFQFDASRQSKRISANVSGFLATMRISLNDNLLDRCSLPEIRAVMGHEIGHYALNHVWEGLLFFGLLMAAGFAFVNGLFERLRGRWGERFGILDIGDIAGLPLLAALFATFIFLMTPVVNSFIRANEAEADLFGLNAAREPDGFAEVALKLGEYRKLSPGPLEESLFFDHPSGRSRIQMAMRWKGEQKRMNPDPK